MYGVIKKFSFQFTNEAILKTAEIFCKGLANVQWEQKVENLVIRFQITKELIFMLD
jgi:hypothetical protein